MPVQRNLSSSDFKNDAVLLQFYESFTGRMEEMKRELPETSPAWHFYYESVLDGYRYKLLQDNRDHTDSLLNFGVAVASAAAASSE